MKYEEPKMYNLDKRMLRDIALHCELEGEKIHEVVVKVKLGITMVNLVVDFDEVLALSTNLQPGEEFFGQLVRGRLFLH